MLYEIINKIQRIQNQILDYIIIVSTKNSYNFGSIETPNSTRFEYQDDKADRFRKKHPALEEGRSAF